MQLFYLTLEHQCFLLDFGLADIVPPPLDTHPEFRARVGTLIWGEGVFPKTPIGGIRQKLWGCQPFRRAPPPSHTRYTHQILTV